MDADIHASVHAASVHEARAKQSVSNGGVGRARRFLRALGPGLISGAADDDPCALATYIQAGAALGVSIVWAPLFILPLLIAVQFMCARVGVVSGSGIASVLRAHYSRWLLWFSCILLAFANTVALAADLGGMAAAARLLTGWPVAWLIPLFATIILALLVFTSYDFIVSVFKWLTLILLVYVVAAVLARPSWIEVLHATFIPRIAMNREYLITLVAVFGSAVSPYLYFWQAAQEVEQAPHPPPDERVLPDRRSAWRRKMGRRHARWSDISSIGRRLRTARLDVVSGMAVAMVITYCIILTAASTLHAQGIRSVGTAEQAAAALTPVAGRAATVLFSLGLIGTGLLGVPVLAASAAYAISEASAWRRGLDKAPNRAARFYAVIAAAIVLGVALNYLHVRPVRLLFLAEVLNGVLAPPLLVVILIISNSKSVMGEHTNRWALNILGGIAASVMGVAAIAMFVSFVR